MPHHRQVDTLQTISVHHVGQLILYLGPLLVQDLKLHSTPQNRIITNLRTILKRLRTVFINQVPHNLHDTVAIQVLNSVKQLIEQTKRTYSTHQPHTLSHFLCEMNIIVSLTELGVTSHLHRIDFSDWPKIMRYILYKNLPHLTGLEVLNLGSCTSHSDTIRFDRFIHDGICRMRNLRILCLCFDANDQLIQILSENCHLIQHLDVTSSRAVTNRSVLYLLKCQHLTELHLHRTSVTASGLTELLIGLPKLYDIGRCDDFSNVLNQLSSTNDKITFNLRRLQTRDLSTDDLRTFVYFFPHIEHLHVFHDKVEADLTVLKALPKLHDLKLLSCDYYIDNLTHLMRSSGTNITHLHFEQAEQVDFQALVEISDQCPNLQSLVMYNCDFTGSNSRYHIVTGRFLRLERLFWMVDGAMDYLEFILVHAFNIRFIHLGSSSGITHTALVRILNINPMQKLEELKVLYSSDMSMTTVNLLLATCCNLKILSELESWQNVTISEIRRLKQYIYHNNYDLDIKPTLSYY